MRLLRLDGSGGVSWSEFSTNIPPYAILSHTWGINEVSYVDLENNVYKTKAGYRKILFCGDQAANDYLQYFWVDTCCIDKRNFYELSKAINSMFRWYQNAAKCYALLSDVSTPTLIDAHLHQAGWKTSFQKSKWFTRGWTLQELIAPASVEFFSLQHQRLGDKHSLIRQVHAATGIPSVVLRGHPLENISIADRMGWAISRQTTEEEDGAYSLFGILGVFMPLIYGEGKQNAFKRLQKEVNELSKKAEDNLIIMPKPPSTHKKAKPALNLQVNDSQYRVKQKVTKQHQTLDDSSEGSGLGSSWDILDEFSSRHTYSTRCTEYSSGFVSGCSFNQSTNLDPHRRKDRTNRWSRRPYRDSSPPRRERDSRPQPVVYHIHTVEPAMSDYKRPVPSPFIHSTVSNYGNPYSFPLRISQYHKDDESGMSLTQAPMTADRAISDQVVGRQGKEAEDLQSQVGKSSSAQLVEVNIRGVVAAGLYEHNQLENEEMGAQHKLHRVQGLENLK